jgi:hypothetical protein
MFTLKYQKETQSFGTMKDLIAFAVLKYNSDNELPFKITKDNLTISEGSNTLVFLMTRVHLMD